MKKKIGILLLSIMVIAAFALAGCGGGSSSSSGTSGASKASLQIIVDFADADSDTKNVEVLLDGESKGTIQDRAHFDSKFDVDGTSHTVTLKDTDTSSQIGESTIEMDKNKSVTFTINKSSVDCSISEVK